MRGLVRLVAVFVVVGSGACQRSDAGSVRGEGSEGGEGSAEGDAAVSPTATAGSDTASAGSDTVDASAGPSDFAALRADTIPRGQFLVDEWVEGGRSVALYVNAERDAAGRMMWDDGHRWLLVAREGERMARLVDQFVPNGVVRFWIVDTAAEDVARIVAQMDSGTVGVVTVVWRFDDDRDGWLAVSAAEATGNLLHRTSPDLFR